MGPGKGPSRNPQEQVRWEARGPLGAGAEEHQGRGRRVPQTCGGGVSNLLCEGVLGERVRSSCRQLIWVGGIERSGREEGEERWGGVKCSVGGKGLGGRVRGFSKGMLSEVWSWVAGQDWSSVGEGRGTPGRGLGGSVLRAWVGAGLEEEGEGGGGGAGGGSSLGA